MFKHVFKFLDLNCLFQQEIGFLIHVGRISTPADFQPDLIRKEKQEKGPININFDESDDADMEIYRSNSVDCPSSTTTFH